MIVELTGVCPAWIAVHGRRGEAVAEPPVTFAGLLRKLRNAARLTQEELAEASGVSPRSISDLERGIASAPRRDTVRLLADALHLPGPARAEFEAVARGRPVPAAPVADAAEALEQALDILRDLDDRSGEAEALNERGALHQVSGELALAEGCHQRALDLAREIGSAWDEAHALAGLGRCARAAGHATQGRLARGT
jgi:transcriptional regulator with XRE-family HTH domain